MYKTDAKYNLVTRIWIKAIFIQYSLLSVMARHRILYLPITIVTDEVGGTAFIIKLVPIL